MRFISKSTFENDYRIKFYDVDKHMNCKISSLVNYLWDVVVAQSEYLGETHGTHINNNLVWLLLKYDIKIYEYPKINDVITADTVVVGVKKFYGYRTHTIRNQEGKVMVEINSIAILVDFDKRRPTKVTQEQYDIYGLDGELQEHMPLDDLATVEKVDIEKIYEVKNSDIDLNNHMNNIKYIERAIDSVPADIMGDYCLEGVKILFKKESVLGEHMTVTTQIIKDENSKITTIHNIMGGDGKLRTKLELKWRTLKELVE